MNQATVGSLLRDFFDFDVNLRVRVDRPEAVDENSPGWDVNAKALELMLEPAGVKDRQSGVMADYSHPVTHVAFSNGSRALHVGERLVERARRHENGTWQNIPAAEVQVYFVLAVERVPGVPAPFAQVKLDLWQMTETRMVQSAG